MVRRKGFLSIILLLSSLVPTVGGAQARITSPREFLGFEVGEDRKLADWDQITSYFKMLDNASDRITVEELGKTTEGRPFIMATISSPENLARLDRYRAQQKRLADPRGLSEAEAEALIREGKVVVLITCNIHSTEVASAQTALEFAWRMATENTPRVRQILDNVILLLIPSLNPDGQQMVVDWYRKYVGTPFEGSSPPWLYHKYVGHDNNRDWYMFTQVETQLTVGKVHNVWHPQIVYDVHQMGMYSARMFMPPWMDPIDPNIDPILVQGMNYLGMSMAADLTAEGKKGIVVNAIYDLWTPARHYQCYHGGLRILTESASVKLATPVEIPFERLEVGRGYNGKQSSWNYLEPWPGGLWRLRDIVDYQLSAFFSLLGTAARDRERFLRNFYLVGKRAVERRSPPYAFVIPAEQKDPWTTAKMINTLRFGLVEVGRARASFEADGRTYPAGSFVIKLAQPYGSFAKTLLERQKYPDLREYPGGPPKRPYDVTAHTLPLLMGVEVVEVARPFSVDLEPVDRAEPPAGGLVKGRSRVGYLIKPDGVNEVVALFHLLKSGVKVYRLMGPDVRPGTAFIPADARAETVLESVARRLALQVEAASHRPNGPALELRLPRIGLYKSYVASMDEGWTRWIFDQFEIPYTSIYDKDIRAGGLERTFDVIILPENSARAIIEGHRRGAPDPRSGTQMPDEYTGGIGDQGVNNLRSFIEAGGTLITLNTASDVVVERFGLGIKDVLAGVSNREFYCPGSILKVNVDTTHPIAFGMERETPIWFEEGPAFEAPPGARVIASYGTGSPLLSGWLLGGEKLTGKAALVDLPLGRGRAVLFGFRPQYRGQSYATFKMFFNALLYASAASMTLE
ncbi:MAG TPA: M14 metallopeptidase family protein [Blastocatellia bacterium]|nr:M14 metallopeptidase family protein [Blastocatellia bacterium]